jgi:hypothetical protein
MVIRLIATFATRRFLTRSLRAAARITGIRRLAQFRSGQAIRQPQNRLVR